VRAALAVARDLLREAAARRWVLGVLAVATSVLLLLAVGLRLEVVDGALAAMRLFGGQVSHQIQAVDVALRPAFRAGVWLVFWGGTGLGILLCADFAPKLLAPGRVEHLLALPVRRGDLLVGTALGVLVLVGVGGLYGGAGLAVILWAKTGVWNAGPLVAALLAVVAFVPVYAAMLAAAVAVRSAAASAAAGLGVLLLGVAASAERTLLPLFESGFARRMVAWGLAPVPRLARLAEAADRLAAGGRLDLVRTAAAGAAALLLGGALLLVAMAQMRNRDY
jgi:Cu-processing system permease protein